MGRIHSIRDNQHRHSNISNAVENTTTAFTCGPMYLKHDDQEVTA